MLLPKWLRTLVFEAIQAAGLDPREFDWDGDIGQSPLTHRPSASYFIFDGHIGAYEGSYKAEESGPWTYKVYTYPTLMERVDGWLNGIKQDIETPDPWAELRRERDMLGSAPEGSVQNTPFTSDEQSQIEAQVREAKMYVRERYELPDDQYRALETTLDYLVEASRLGWGRIDWRNAVVGAFATLVIESVLPPDLMRDILGHVLRGLVQLFGGLDIPALPPS